MGDYLAMINTNGIGIWARSDSKDRAVKNLVRIFHADWKKLLKPKDGAKSVTVKIKVYDVEGHEEVWWDDLGIYGNGDEPLGRVPEIVEHTYTKW